MAMLPLLRRFLLVAIAVALASDFCIAAPEGTARPRVGLVLAGGGAKGGAHVGVLVGGGYASGIPASDLEKFVTTIDWKKVVGSQGRRELEPMEQTRAGATYSNEFEFGLGQGGALRDR